MIQPANGESRLRSRATSEKKVAKNATNNNTKTHVRSSSEHHLTSSSSSSSSKSILCSIVSRSNHPVDDENTRWWACLALITIAAFASRLYKIEQPNHVWYVAFSRYCDVQVSYDSIHNITAGTRHTLARWVVGTSIILSSSTYIHHLARYIHNILLPITLHLPCLLQF